MEPGKGSVLNGLRGVRGQWGLWEGGKCGRGVGEVMVSILSQAVYIIIILGMYRNSFYNADWSSNRERNWRRLTPSLQVILISGVSLPFQEPPFVSSGLASGSPVCDKAVPLY